MDDAKYTVPAPWDGVFKVMINGRTVQVLAEQGMDLVAEAHKLLEAGYVGRLTGPTQIQVMSKHGTKIMSTADRDKLASDDESFRKQVIDGLYALDGHIDYAADEKEEVTVKFDPYKEVAEEMWPTKCECGSESVGSPYHSTWCPKGKK